MNKKKITPLPPHRGGNPFHEEPPILEGGGVKQNKEKRKNGIIWKRRF